MCVAAIAWHAHRDWQLVAIGNRDEYHARPAAPLARWDTGILAGCDLQSGGTWLGVSEQGRFALITNRRGFGDPAADKASRGALVTGLLRGAGSYGDAETAALGDFNPFNLILTERNTARFLSNQPDTIRSALTHGIFGLSNGMLDEPWAKTLQLKAALNNWLVAGERDLAPLFMALRSEQLGKIGLHPAIPSDMPLEAPETPVFINNPTYGTRCSTVIAVDHSGQGRMIERRFDTYGQAMGDTRLDFVWPD